MTLDFFPEQRHHCLGCEDGCCNRFEVQATEEEAKAIMARRLPNTPENFEDCFAPGPYGEFVVKKDTAGHCVFAEGRLCKLHKLYGISAKPLSCRVFPFHIQHWADGRISAELRFICPAVGLDGGKTSREMEHEVLVCARAMGLRRGANDTVYSAANPAPLRVVRYIHEAYRKLLRNPDFPWKVRLYAAARILDFHRRKDCFDAIAKADENFAGESAKFVSKAAIPLAREVAQGKYDSLTQAEFRNLFCGYLRDDQPEDRRFLRRLRRGVLHLKLMANLAPLSAMNPNAPNLPLGVFPRATSDISFSAGAVEIFENFFFGKLDSMHFCGDKFHHFDYETGLSHLLLSAPVIFSLAAGFALEKGQAEASREMMHAAVRLADFTFGRSPFFRMAPAKKWIRSLIQPARYAGLLNQTLRHSLPVAAARAAAAQQEPLTAPETPPLQTP